MTIRNLVAALALALAAAALGSAGPAHSQSKPDEQIRQLMLSRNENLRAALLKAWLVPSAKFDAAKVEVMATSLYASEARLSMLGMERPIIDKGCTMSEIPLCVLSERSGEAFDMFATLKGRTFTIPAEAAR
jgi:hypothetical protein